MKTSLSFLWIISLMVFLIFITTSWINHTDLSQLSTGAINLMIITAAIVLTFLSIKQIGYCAIGTLDAAFIVQKDLGFARLGKNCLWTVVMIMPDGNRVLKLKYFGDTDIIEQYLINPYAMQDAIGATGLGLVKNEPTEIGNHYRLVVTERYAAA